ncbi:MAG: putative LPS assembly protein LptD, partial [Flavobacteriaceae bacterium]
MPSKKLIGAFLFFWVGWNLSWAQQVSSTMASSTLSENLPKLASSDSLPNSNKPMLLDQVKYNAVKLMRIDKKTNTLLLVDKAEMYYQDITLKAGIIVLDYAKQEVYAGRIPDTTGTLTQYPYFKQANNEVNPDSIRFNFETKKALIWNSNSAQNGMDVFSGFTKKQNDSVYYLKEAKVTTAGDLKNADYYFRIRKGKLVPGGKIVTGFTNMYIADVPTPLMLPFAYFPSNQRLESGFIFPTIGESNDRGYYLQNGGYYLALSEYFDLSLTGDYYSNGSYGIRGDTQYKVRYKFGGQFSFRYENLITGSRGLPEYTKSTVFNLRWSHRKDPKASPNSNFSASVNFGSSDYFRQSINQLNSPNFLNNNLSSSVSYSKTFPAYPRVNTSITASISQNSRTQEVNLTLPTFQANMERIFPFAPKEGVKKGALKNINLQYSTRAENRTVTTEDQLFSADAFKNARAGMKHSIPVGTNFKLFKYISMSVGGNYSEVWTPKTVRYRDYDPEIGTAVKDTISEFGAFRQYSFSASLGTTLYGTFNFKPTRKIQSIRHTLRPSVSFSNAPSFERYYDTYIVDADGNTAEYTRYETSLFGRPSRNRGQSMGITLSNAFEAKVKSKDTAATEPKKIKLLNNLNFSTSYNILAEEFQWSPIRMNTGFKLFKDELSVNLNATFDPYALDENNRRINTSHLQNGGGLARMTSANMNLSYSFSSKKFKSKTNQRSQEESQSGGGRDDDLFGIANNFSDSRMNNPFPEKQPSNQEDKQEDESVNFFSTEIPWDLRFAYSLTYRNNIQQRELSNNSLMFSGNVELTPKWKIGLSSGYDFKGKGFTYTQLRFDRDLNSWRLNFD